MIGDDVLTRGAASIQSFNFGDDALGTYLDTEALDRITHGGEPLNSL